jgi:hypothetical protein
MLALAVTEFGSKTSPCQANDRRSERKDEAAADSAYSYVLEVFRKAFPAIAAGNGIEVRGKANASIRQKRSKGVWRGRRSSARNLRGFSLP